MKRFVIAFALTCVCLSASAQDQAAANTLSPAEKSIAKAKEVIAKDPKNFEGYNALALALSRRARETSDPDYYTQAEKALEQSFRISPNNFDGSRTKVWLLLGKHEFAAARKEAIALNARMADDPMTYAFLTDANIELGNYKEAETAAQTLLDIRPGTLPGLTRAAYLRELFGDVDGALDLMSMALESTSPNEVEDRAWIAVQMAHLNLSVGRIDKAETLCRQALQLFPNYHYALANLAKVRIQQQRYPEAVDLLRKRYEQAAHAENMFDLAEALTLAGRNDEAKTAFAEFEHKSLLETDRADNSNHELVMYYADYAHDPVKALQVAQREYDRRKDVFTLDHYAWALHVNGRDREARQQVEAALAVGTHDARMLDHAGEIALALQDTGAARKFLVESITLHTIGSGRADTVLDGMTKTNAQVKP
jgi:tetratricopeptide (TPR) repeat protein